MMILTPFDSPQFSLWSGLASLGIAGAVPAPQLK